MWKLYHLKQNINSLKKTINDTKMPDKKKTLPYTQLIFWLEQQHHIITLAPEGPAWVRHHTYLFSVRLKGKVCSHNMQPANASVLGIMKSASGCWLCLTCKLRIGDTHKWWQTTWWGLWSAMTGTLFTAELMWKWKEQRKTQKMLFSILTVSDKLLARCSGVFSCPA